MKFTKKEIKSILSGNIERNVGAIVGNVKVYGNKEIKEYNSATLMEYVGRLCYNSMNKICEGSHVDFLSHGARAGHRSVFEFSNLLIDFCIPKESFDNVKDILNKSKYIEWRHMDNETYDYVIISIYGSLLAIIEIMEQTVDNNIEVFCNLFNAIINSEFKFILDNWKNIDYMSSIYELYNKMVFKDTHLVDLLTMPSSNHPNNKILVEITVDRGIHVENIRHRPCSFMAQSQRYIRITSEFPLIISVPRVYFDDIEFMTTLLNSTLNDSIAYAKILENNPPQKARYTLNNATACTYFVYATKSQWHHMFNLRTANSAHPGFVEIMKDARDQMINKKLL